MKTCQSAIVVLAALAAVVLPTAVLAQAGPPNAPRGSSSDRPSSPAPARVVCFRPGEPWLDNHGAPINAHGGGILCHKGIYWWFGQHMIEGKAGNQAMVGVHVYSSTDLNHWQDKGIALRVSDDPQSEIARGCILERPKVILNRKTGQFVMWFHLELKGQGYTAARAGVAVSDTPAGPYRYLGSVRPNAGAIPLHGSKALKQPLNPQEREILRTGRLPQEISREEAADLYFRRDFAHGHDVRDMTLYMDDDQTAYLIFASEQNWSLHVVRLSEDYLRPTDQYARVLVGKQYEAPAVLKHAGKYWLFGSHCTGWAPNPARLAVADSIFGPYQELGNPWQGPAEQTKISFDSQSTFVLPVEATPGAFIFLADRWRPHNAIDGRHIWVPVLWRDGRPALEWMDQWDLTLFDRRLDARAGVSSSRRSGNKAVSDPWDMLTAQPESLHQWQDARFGMFVCWGPVSMTGLEIGWSRGAPRGQGFLLREGEGPTPGEVYDNLYKQWKPDRFDAQAWVQLAREGGQKYVIFLVKHHDGFCLYDSKLTDYKSTGPASAWKHDVMADVAKACHEAGLKLVVYYSQPDWHHPDYGTANHSRYIQYLHGQIRELLTRYGRIDGFWFDLGGKPEDWDSVKLFRMMRSLQPWLVINNRCGLPGDYDTPEQRLGPFQLERPWETCMTLGTQWSWKPDDRIKSLKRCIDVLVTCAGRNGNLALNTNPMPDGRVEPRQAERFREIGRWLSQYGRSIYATRGGPFWGLHCLSTRKDNTIYIHVLKWHGDRLVLPGIPRKIVASRVLTGGKASVRQSPQEVEIVVPPEHQQALDTIIVLELDGPAGELKPARIASDSLTFGKKVTASSVYPEPVGKYYQPAFAVDGDPETGWTFAPKLKSAWLEIDLGRPSTFDRVEIREVYDRVRGFRVQTKQGRGWVTLCQGRRIGEDFHATFPGVTAQFVRLEVLDTTINPLIAEFHLYATGTRHVSPLP